MNRWFGWGENEEKHLKASAVPCCRIYHDTFSSNSLFMFLHRLSGPSPRQAGFPTWAMFSINTCSLRLFPSLLPVTTPFHCFLPRHHLCTPRSLSDLRRSHAHFLSSGNLQMVPQPNLTCDFYVKRQSWERRHLVKLSFVQHHHALGSLPV